MSLLLSKRWGWVFPLLCIIVLIPISNAYDVALSQLFYRPEIKKFTNTEFLSIVYRYAQLPALLTGIAAGLLWFAAPLLPKIKRYRPYLAVLALTLALGPGLLVNVVLKPNWGRPRPRHVIELGGEAKFRPFYSPNWGPWKRDFYKSMP
ncbi:MAG: hypothetical protein KDK48_04800, partial [Chlamydiia bacterium]|nr:hypothetical protein [Chlamydiia bacterium]